MAGQQTRPAAVKSARLKIGMEVHVELATRTKMFTRIANIAHPDFYDAPPNSLIDPIVAALPGALPVMNRTAVEMSIMVGLALNCEISEFSKWDRKNYFYPDLPKGYQISQYDLPLCFDGELEIPAENGAMKKIGIIRAHLEEDTGKLGHELPGGAPYDGSLVDLNRAGTPLLEIVTQPDLESAQQAVTFGQELRNICRFLGVTEGVMQRGHMRFEPNVNVIITTADGHEFVTPIVEIKNLNSFKSLHGAIEYEFNRQVEQWKDDGIVHIPGGGLKSTRGWDDVNNQTFLQREKEEAHDYRYFPEPDLVPVTVSKTWHDELAARLPELPMPRRARYRDTYGLSEAEAIALTDDPKLTAYYEACIDSLGAIDATRASAGPPNHPGHMCAKWLLNAAAKRANEKSIAIHELGVPPHTVAQLLDLRDRGELGSTAADELFGLLCEPANRDADVLKLARERGLMQVRDEAQLERWVDDAIAAQPQAAADFAAGKDAAAGRILGHIMKASGGQADAKAVQAMLRKRLRN